MALVYVTIMVALVGLVLAPMLRFVYTGHRVSQIREQRMLELYSADAGIEDAMYQIKSNIAGISDLDYGDSYDPGTPDDWNDRDMNVQVEKVWIPEDICLDCDDVETPAPTDLTDFSDELVMAGLYSSVELAAATDDFEYPPDPVWGRGAGWADLWEHGGSAIEGIDGDSTSGIGYLSLAGADGYARRQTDLVGFFDPRLQFYAKATSFEPGDSADLSVSTNGADWTTVMTWADGNDTDAYEFVDLDVSAYANATEFWVEFDATLLGGTLASDGFESDDWSGGTGWTGDWLHSGDSSVRSGGGPYEGSYHVRLRRSSGYIARAVDLSASGEATLTFQWKASSFESGDAAYLLVSADGLDWTPVRSWQNGDDDGQYHLEEIDLSSYAAGSSEFWIAFDAGMSSSYDYFYIDDVHIGDNDRFQVDDVWIGNDVDIYTIEVAYTESIGSVFMEGLAVWLPPGAQYIGVTDAWGLPGGAPTRQITSFAGGTVLYWEYASRIDLSQPPSAARRRTRACSPGWMPTPPRAVEAVPTSSRGTRDTSSTGRHRRPATRSGAPTLRSRCTWARVRSRGEGLRPMGTIGPRVLLYRLTIRETPRSRSIAWSRATVGPGCGTTGSTMTGGPRSATSRRGARSWRPGSTGPAS